MKLESKKCLLKPKILTGMRPSLKCAKLFLSSVSKTLCGITMNLERLLGKNAHYSFWFIFKSLTVGFARKCHFSWCFEKKHLAQDKLNPCCCAYFTGLLLKTDGVSGRKDWGCWFTSWTSQSGHWLSWLSILWPHIYPALVPSLWQTQTSSCGLPGDGCLETASFLVKKHDSCTSNLNVRKHFDACASGTIGNEGSVFIISIQMYFSK